MVNTTRRSFLAGLFGFALAGAPLASEAATKKTPAPIKTASLKKKTPLIAPKQKTVQSKPISNDEKLTQLYMPLCEHLEGTVPFVYEDKKAATIGCGVHFKNFSELDNLSAIKIVPKKGCSLKLDKKRIEQIATANWTNPKTRTLFPEVEKIEQVKLKDCKGDFPTSKTETWNKELFWAPKTTLEKANRCAAKFCVQKAKECHPNLFQLPPSARLVIVDLIYNLGDGKYSSDFPKFQRAVKQKDFASMKKECKTKNLRRDTVREWLIESARLANGNTPILSEEKIKKLLRKDIAKDFFLSPSREGKLWGEIDKCTGENCSWKIAQNNLARKMCQVQRG